LREAHEASIGRTVARLERQGAVSDLYGSGAIAPGVVCPTLSVRRCPGCWSTRFRHVPVLWSSLVNEWDLSAEEAEMIDRQQGFACERCRLSLRTMALATAIMRGDRVPFGLWALAHPRCRVLEINTAGNLHRYLRLMHGHQLVEYPAVDMMALPFDDGTFDLVVHSDTLEHVADPVLGLSEIRRVLRPRGRTCFTVPVVPGRMTRRRDDEPPSFHGAEDDLAYLVHLEFGADVWTTVMDAGFRNCELRAFEYPAALAITASA
jgi:SAM-dependent methyltransferase